MFGIRDQDWVGLDDAPATADSGTAPTWRDNMTAAMCAIPLPSFPFSYQDENFVVAALFCAVEEGNYAGLEELFSMSHINPNQSNKHGETAVHIASGLAQLQILKLLHSKGANLKLADSHGDSAMYWAARQGHTDVIQYLWENGVSVDCQNKSGETALHVAARYGHHPAVKLLCSFGANINVADEHGDTALHIAAWHGFPTIMHVLCEAGAHTHLRNKEGETPIHTASARGHLESVRCLLEAGADPDLLDKHGCTALHLALRRHHVAVALLLLHNGCQTDVVDNHGETAIHVAARDGLLSVAQTLCAFGCKVDVPNKAGLYPLHLAAKNGHTEIVRCLCLAGCNVDQKNRDGIPAEITALAQGHSSIGDLLNRLRNEQLKEEYIAQMIPGTQPLSRIKLKVLGHSGVGKTTMLESLKCGYFSSWFRRSKTSPTSPKPKSTSGPHSSRSSTPAMDEYTIDTDSENNIRTADLNDASEMNDYKKAITPPALLISSCTDMMSNSQPLFSETTNVNYTHGIDVQQVTVSGVGDLSIWEFSGHEPYLMLYDHFVGNAHCLHLVVFSLAEPVHTQIRQVSFWLAYLQARAPPVEPLGMGGKSASPLRVALVATHADVCASNINRNQNCDALQQQNNAEADAKIILAAARERFQHVFDLHETVFVVDAHVVGSQSMKSLKQYLSNNRAKIVQNLPKSTGFLESMVGHLPNWRKSSPSFPVLTWRQFMDMVHIQVNPLAGEEHMRELIHQLQLMGEVLYTKSETEDTVVLNPKWLCSSVIGELLSQEHLEKARVTGCYTVEDFQFAFPDTDAIDLLQVLENLKMCTKCDNDGDVEYEFPCYNLVETLEGLWDPSDPRYTQGVYCGVHVLPFDDFPHILAIIFTRIQVQLRRASMEHADSDSDLYQWLRGSKFCSGALEGMLTLVDNDSALEVKVRGPRGSSSSCFYFLEDLLMVVDDVLGEVCPGAQFERHLLSAADLRHHAPTPARYPARLVMRAMLNDGGLHAQVLHPQTGMPESACDLLCCRDVASVASLVCGPDTHASQLSLLTRQRLGAALDPPEKLGRDWCLLAVQLGMTERLPELDPESKESGVLATSGKSPIARVLGEWTLVMDSTIGHLARALDELGRGDAADIVLGTSPLVKVAVASAPTSPASPPAGRHDDARVAAAVSAASSSNISR
ncbi:death-associated protein kinase 1-like isoform X1 [Dermacentor andersoni]|uniref:death-associated protein kinase 1-like isoform X1 n=2 Tax=Dermacentor andersoni TaxID=34620 RepID=UPI002155F86D|nr:death-associated protein kinase 1-like isoform X1 [Dermacentor andersoni]